MDNKTIKELAGCTININMGNADENTVNETNSKTIFDYILNRKEETTMYESRKEYSGNTHFRMARQGDEAAILSLYQKAQSGDFCVWDDNYPTMAEIRQDLDTNNLYVMTDDGSKIIGAISVVPENELDSFGCWSHKDSKEIARVVIDNAYQGQGLSFKMVQRIESILRSSGDHGIHLAVVKSNIPAYRTYLKAGFSVVGEAQMYGHDYYLMEKIV